MGNENMNISLREALPADEHFLFEVYASTRDEEFANVGWDENQKLSFLKMQFMMRERSYPRVDNRIIMVDGRDAGRILVDRKETEILLVDIALLTEHRNTGTGSQLIRDLLEEANAGGKRVRLHVLRMSPAARLYERLGFHRSDAGDGVYVEMIWSPPPRSDK
jgi:GNAT superfamily N-acetyltransferase